MRSWGTEEIATAWLISHPDHWREPRRWRGDRSSRPAPGEQRPYTRADGDDEPSHVHVSGWEVWGTGKAARGRFAEDAVEYERMDTDVAVQVAPEVLDQGQRSVLAVLNAIQTRSARVEGELSPHRRPAPRGTMPGLRPGGRAVERTVSASLPMSRT